MHVGKEMTRRIFRLTNEVMEEWKKTSSNLVRAIK
jgi:hypothetical protein